MFTGSSKKASRSGDLQKGYVGDGKPRVTLTSLLLGIMLKLVCRMKMAASLAILSKMLQKLALRARVFKSTYTTIDDGHAREKVDCDKLGFSVLKCDETL